MRSSPPECILVYNRRNFFLCTNLLAEIARAWVSSTLLDEKSTSIGIADALRFEKLEGKNRRGVRDETCDHGLSRSWKVETCKNKNMKRDKRPTFTERQEYRIQGLMVRTSACDDYNSSNDEC